MEFLEIVFARKEVHRKKKNGGKGVFLVWGKRYQEWSSREKSLKVRKV